MQSRQLILQHVHLDPNLLEIHIDNANGLSKEILSVMNIAKTELPPQTLL